MLYSMLVVKTSLKMRKNAMQSKNSIMETKNTPFHACNRNEP